MSEMKLFKESSAFDPDSWIAQDELFFQDMKKRTLQYITIFQYVHCVMYNKYCVLNYISVLLNIPENGLLGIVI